MESITLRRSQIKGARMMRAGLARKEKRGDHWARSAEDDRRYGAEKPDREEDRADPLVGVPPTVDPPLSSSTASNTTRLAQLAAQAGANRLTFVSHSLAAPNAPAADLRAKFHAEEAIVASGVPYTIFRPTYFMDTLPRHLRGKRARVLGRQAHALHMVAAADFARLVSRSLAVPETAGTCLDVHGPEAITIPDALRTYCDQLAPGTRVVSMPCGS